MDISALVHHDGDAAVLPRRSLSHPHSLSAPSPSPSAARLPTPSKPTRRQMPLKRKRHDPKPIWAYREGEQLSPELQRQQEQFQQSRPPPPAAQPQPTPQPQAHHPPPPIAHRGGPPLNGNGAPPQAMSSGLTGFERPISNDAYVADDTSKRVCDFIWLHAITNGHIRTAIAQSELAQLEIEARWGHIIERSTKQRLRGYHDTETALKPTQVDMNFESTMTMEQHKRMNNFLNAQVSASVAPGVARPPVKYQHTKEVDMFYALGPDQMATMPEVIRDLIVQSGIVQRIRVTRDQKTGQVIRSMIKLRIANLEISSPKTEWDYRVGINVEIVYPGPVESLTQVVEQGKTDEGTKRQKDRMSYSWLGAYQVDLTQVQQGPTRNHELELELDSNVLLDHADRARKGEASKFQELIGGMMNNLRVLSRIMTKPGAA